MHMGNGYALMMQEELSELHSWLRTNEWNFCGSLIAPEAKAAVEGSRAQIPGYQLIKPV